MRDLRSTNPRRPVDWRWQRISHLVDNEGRVSASIDDEWIVKGRRFAQALKRCRSDEHHIALAENNPEMYEPWALFEDGADKDTRGAIEARLLAREDAETISRKVGYTPEQIEFYHQWFFDVRSRLNQVDLITTAVFSKSVQAGLSEREYDCLWKLYGYHGGGEILDMVINKFAPRGSADKIVAFFKDDFKATLAMKGGIAIRTMPINWQTQVEIANLWMRLEEMERSGGEGGGAEEGILANVRAFFEELPWAKASKIKTSGNIQIDLVDKGSVAVRASELTVMGAGNTTPAMQALIASAAQAYFPGAEVIGGTRTDDA